VEKCLKYGGRYVLDIDVLRRFFLHRTKELCLKDRGPCNKHTSMSMEQLPIHTECHIGAFPILEETLKLLR
jgi:hypothetical protein